MADFEAEVLKLNDNDNTLNELISSLQSQLDNKIAEVHTKYDYKLDNIDTIIESLKLVDLENTAKINELINKVDTLLNVPKYNVTFDTNGAESIEGQIVEFGDKITAPLNPTKDGYIFDGWYYGEEKWSFIGYTVSEDMTLTARWLDTYDIPEIIFENKIYEYDGIVKTLKISNEEELPDGLFVIYAGNSRKEVGNTLAHAYIMDENGYTYQDVTAVLTIEKANLNFSMNDLTITYDGKEHSILVNEQIPYGVNVTYENNYKINSGNYEVVAKFSVSDNYNEIDDVTANLTIHKVTPTVTVTHDSNNFTLKDPVVLTLNSTVEGSVKLNDNQKIVVGTKDYTYTFTPFDTLNYNCVTGTVEITAYSKVTFYCENMVISEQYLEKGQLAEYFIPNSVINRSYRYNNWDEFVEDFLNDFNAYVYGGNKISNVNAFWDQSFISDAELQKKFCEFFATEDWSWFGDIIDKGIEAAGWTSYGKDHYYYYRCNVYEYLTKTQRTAWPASCGSFHNMETPSWIGNFESEYDYTFVEWMYNGSPFDFTSPIYTSIDIYADFTKQRRTYSITYNLNGGINSYENPDSYTIDSEDIWLSNPSRSGYYFAGWYLDSDFSERVETIQPYKKEDVTVYAKWSLYEIFREGIYEYIYLGRYPQTVVTDSNLIKKLDNISHTNEYGYYEYNGCEYKKIVTDYIYNNTSFNVPSGNIINNKIYYFKVEPIKWRIMYENDKTFKLICEKVIDRIEYYDFSGTRTINGQTIKPTNFEYSNLNAWLNGYNGTSYNVADYTYTSTGLGFYNLAFNSKEKLLIVGENTTSGRIRFVDILDYYDALNSSYGFSNMKNLDELRQCKATDYTISRSLEYYSSDSSYNWNASYFLSTDSSDGYVYGVHYNGNVQTYYYYSNLGVRPVITITK